MADTVGGATLISANSFHDIVVRRHAESGRVELNFVFGSSPHLNLTYPASQKPLDFTASSGVFSVASASHPSGNPTESSQSISVYEVRYWHTLVSTKELQRLLLGSYYHNSQPMGNELAAWFFEGADLDTVTNEYWIAKSNEGDGSLPLTTYTLRPTPHRPAIDRQSVWLVSATYSSAGTTAGTRTFTLLVDGVSTGCTWSITRSTLSAGLGSVATESNYLVRCLNATAVKAGPHTIQITSAGANVVTASHTDITLVQTDSIVSDRYMELSNQQFLNRSIEGFNMTVQHAILESVEIALPLMFFVLMVIWAETKKEWLIYLGATVTGGLVVITFWEEIETFRLIAIVATIIVALRGYLYYQETQINK